MLLHTNPSNRCEHATAVGRWVVHKAASWDDRQIRGSVRRPCLIALAFIVHALPILARRGELLPSQWIQAVECTDKSSSDALQGIGIARGGRRPRGPRRVRRR